MVGIKIFGQVDSHLHQAFLSSAQKYLISALICLCFVILDSYHQLAMDLLLYTTKALQIYLTKPISLSTVG